MNILVIGNNSMLGSRIIDRLTRQHFVRSAGRSGGADFFFDLSAEPNQMDARFDVIVHCAASFATGGPAGMIQNEIVNAVGALRVGTLAVQTGCRHVVYLSSISAIEHPENECFNSYGLSKRHGEENLEHLCRESGIALTVLRLSQIYDELGEASKHQPFLYHIVSSARRGEGIALYGKGDPKRNFLFADDATKIVSLVVEKRVDGIFPCINPQSHRLSEVADTACKVFASSGTVTFHPEKPDIPSIHIPQNFELFELIGYYPETSLVQGLELIRKARGGGR